ncbi:hypothetical protein [Thiobacillus sp.]|uniref:hypothetical protein n=1 Tax=Thiobacillus sp. TaxID=924 RepID=UPI0025F19195|nr:hypothetical protein [Thiobacillus sp.]
MNGRHPGVAAIALVALLALPPLRAWLEASMAAHMLLQMPLLAAAGAFGALALPRRLARWLAAHNAHGVPLTLLAGLVSSYWMLPRALDAALADPWMELAKFASLPLLVGLPLALSWRPLGAIGRGFVAANVISMVAVAGWLYIVSPVRICNSYRVDEQALAGWLLVAVAGVLSVAWAAPAFFSRRNPATAGAAKTENRAQETRSVAVAGGRLR